MRFDRHTFADITAVATQSARGCQDWTDKVVHYFSTDFSGTAKLQGTIDGTNWHTIETVVGTGGTLDVSVDVWGAWSALRWDCTAWAAGTLSSLLGFRNARTD
jgi:hypothetical protein